MDGEGDVGFDVSVVPARRRMPRLGVGALLQRHLPVPCAHGDLDDDEDIVCTVHGPNQDDDPEGRTDLEAQALEAIHG
ncbi:hypothetical protein [Streptomyces marokkonensis]|uniref:hypothetical protein n=1 Tax=Streptomyces marokkonensis TaxID=324855 RepID=UPI003CCB526A